jgi:hypothetical protein
MKNARSLLFIVSAMMLTLVPLVAGAAPLVPQSNNPSKDYTQYGLCQLGQLGQNIIDYAIVFAIPLAAILIGYAGFLYITSGANPGNVNRAKSIFGTALIGFLVAISGWLIVNTILVALFAGGKYFENGEWFKIPCQQGRLFDNGNLITQWLGTAPQGSPLSVGGGSAYGCDVGTLQNGSCYDADNNIIGPATIQNNSSNSGYTCDAGYSLVGYQCYNNDNPSLEPIDATPPEPASGASIAASADAYYGTPTNTGPDTDYGNKACAWAVNQVLNKDGIATLGDGYTVASMEKALQDGGRGTAITDPSQIQKGDIVIWGVGSHVGIVTGFDENKQPIVTSNSSSERSFSQRSSAPSGSRFYRVNY